MARKGSRTKLIPIVIVVVVAVSVASLGYLLARGGPSGPIVVEYKTYTNENYAFKFDYPANWYFEEISLRGAVVFGAFDKSSNEVSITLTVYDKNAAENLFGVPLDNIISYLLSENSPFNNLAFPLEFISAPTEIAIDNYHGISYSFFVRPTFQSQMLVEDVVKDNLFIQLSMIADSKNYSIYEPIFQHVIDSFSFLDHPSIPEKPIWWVPEENRKVFYEVAENENLLILLNNPDGSTYMYVNFSPRFRELVEEYGGGWEDENGNTHGENRQLFP